MSYCSNCGFVLSESMKFCSSCGTAKNERITETNIKLKPKNKFGVLKKIAVFSAISFAIFFVTVNYLDHKEIVRREAASNQMQCDNENDGEACLLYAEFILKDADAKNVSKHYLNKACTLIPDTENPERLANICADAENFVAACNFGHAKSCYDEGRYSVEQFLETNGRKPRNDQAHLVGRNKKMEKDLKTVRQSCALGYAEGCDLYVRAILLSEYHHWDLGEISNYANQACEAEYQASCYFIEKGYFAAYGNIGELKNNAPLDYIRRIPPSVSAAFDLNLSGRCTATVNISKYGEIERVVDISCNHVVFEKIMKEDLFGYVYYPLLLDGRPARRINEVITQDYLISDERGRPLPFE